jgi:glycosyltransferase involved in cell wall biosynthesis
VTRASLRILQLSNFYAPLIGGLERNVATTSEELVRRGHRVSVLTLATPQASHDEVSNGVRIRRVASLGNAGPAWAYANRRWPFHPTAADPVVVAAIARILRSDPFDLVHSHDWLMYSYLPLRFGRWGVPHVHTAHDYGLACPKKSLVYKGRDAGATCPGRQLTRCIPCASSQYGRVKGTFLATAHAAHRHRGIDRLTAVSSAVAAALDDARKPAALPVTVLPTMVPDDILTAGAAARPDWVPEGPFILFVGALGPHKGLDVLFDAYSRLAADWPGATAVPELVCVGTGRPDTPAAPTGARLVRDVPHAHVMAAWRAAAVGAVPSTWAEPLGQVAVEALLSGTPLVASAVGGLVDVVRDDHTGLLVPPRDPAALAGALRRVLTDPELAARLSAEGHRHAQTFTAGRVVPRLEEIYHDCLS